MNPKLITTKKQTMLSSLIFNLIKWLFGSSSKKETQLSPREEQIFNKTLHVKNKENMIERIDYWIEKQDFQEAKKLANLYVEYNGKDDNISQRISELNS